MPHVTQKNESMGFLSLTPNIIVDDVNETIDFYQNVLGFEMISSVPEKGKLDWAMMKNGETMLMFQNRESIENDLPMLNDLPSGGSFTLFFVVDDVMAIFEKVKSEVDIVQDIHTTFYDMIEFSFADLNGVIVTLAQQIAS